MDRDEKILKVIAKTGIYSFSTVKRVFQMSFSFDLTLMALDMALRINISPENIVKMSLMWKNTQSK